MLQQVAQQAGLPPEQLAQMIQAEMQGGSGFAGQSYDKFRNIIGNYMDNMPKSRSFGNWAQNV